MGWSVMTTQNLWAQISYHKYIWPKSLLDWIRLPTWQTRGCSSMWKALIYSLPHIRDNLVWRINDGSLGRFGQDPWIGSEGRHILSTELIRHLHTWEIMVFADIVDQQNIDTFSQAWKLVAQLDLPPQWRQEWLEYTTALSESHIRIKQGTDEIVWCLADNGIYSPKPGYFSLIQHRKPDMIMNWWRDIWKLASPPRIRLFFWCVLKDIVPTGEHLIHRALYGPSWCILCKAASESNVHLFLQCTTIRPLWQNLSSSIGFALSWNGGDLQSAWEDWISRHSGSKLLNLPLVVNWHIWKARNRNIFDNKVLASHRSQHHLLISRTA